MKLQSSFLSLLVAGCALLAAPLAVAATNDVVADDPPISGDEPVTGKKGKDAVDPNVLDAQREASLADSPIEKPNKTYYFVGARYRGIVVPQFMMNLFGDGGTTVYVNSFGPEFAVRKDNMEYNFSAWWAGYYMDPTPFKASTDPATAYEVVESKMNVLYLTTDFMWTQQFNPVVGMNFGMGAGFGFVWGDLLRTQAYPNGRGGYAACSGPGSPDSEYCGPLTDNNHYAGYTENSWADGGSKPIIFPWLALQTGLRIKPHRNFVMRLDGGFGVTGFFFGAGADYGI
jgi:hypothetical protein